LIVTNGDKGCGNLTLCGDWSPEQIAFTRRQEAFNAAAIYSIPETNVILLDYEDSMLTSYHDEDVRSQIVSHIRTIKPTVVMSWYPYPNFQMRPSLGWSDLGFHPDHQQAGKLALDSHFDSGIPLAFPESGPSWKPKEYYMFGFIDPTNYVELDRFNVDQKIQAYLQHKTQINDPLEWEAQLRLLANRVAFNSGLRYNDSAEAFIAFF